MSVSEWDNEYARLARASSQLRTAGLATNTNTTTDVTAVLRGLTNLDSALNALPLQPNEIQRRRFLIHNLQNTVRSPPATNGSGAVLSSNPSSSGNGSGSLQPQQQSQLQLAMNRQDELIDELAVGVGRLKNQTISIGDEARMHVNLLGDMESNLDAAQAALDAETRRAARVKEDQSVWRLQLIVAALFILFVLLVFMGLTP